MRKWSALIGVCLVALLASTACGGAGKAKLDDVASCLKDSGSFPVVKDGDKGQIRYAGSEGGIEATYGTTQAVQVDVLIGSDSGEASNLQSNLAESGLFVDSTRVRNAVYAIPVSYERSPNRAEAGDAAKACL